MCLGTRPLITGSENGCKKCDATLQPGSANSFLINGLPDLSQLFLICLRSFVVYFALIFRWRAEIEEGFEADEGAFAGFPTDAAEAKGRGRQ